MNILNREKDFIKSLSVKKKKYIIYFFIFFLSYFIYLFIFRIDRIYIFFYFFFIFFIYKVFIEILKEKVINNIKFKIFINTNLTLFKGFLSFLLFINK
jgi:hypothetical protein